MPRACGSRTAPRGSESSPRVASRRGSFARRGTSRHDPSCSRCARGDAVAATTRDERAALSLGACAACPGIGVHRFAWLERLDLSRGARDRLGAQVDVEVGPREHAWTGWTQRPRFRDHLPATSALRPPRGMFRIGPRSAHVDVTTRVDGIGDFEIVWRRREPGEFFGVPVSYLSLADMLRTKRAAGRPKDLGDVAWLEAELHRRRSRGR
jgi:hypothetical protein